MILDIIVVLILMVLLFTCYLKKCNYINQTLNILYLMIFWYFINKDISYLTISILVALLLIFTVLKENTYRLANVNIEYKVIEIILIFITWTILMHILFLGLIETYARTNNEYLYSQMYKSEFVRFSYKMPYIDSDKFKENYFNIYFKIQKDDLKNQLLKELEME